MATTAPAAEAIKRECELCQKVKVPSAFKHSGATFCRDCEQGLFERAKRTSARLRLEKKARELAAKHSPTKDAC